MAIPPLPQLYCGQPEASMMRLLRLFQLFLQKTNIRSITQFYVIEYHRVIWWQLFFKYHKCRILHLSLHGHWRSNIARILFCVIAAPQERQQVPPSPLSHKVPDHKRQSAQRPGSGKNFFPRCVFIHGFRPASAPGILSGDDQQRPFKVADEFRGMEIQPA